MSKGSVNKASLVTDSGWSEWVGFSFWGIFLRKCMSCWILRGYFLRVCVNCIKSLYSLVVEPVVGKVLTAWWKNARGIAKAEDTRPEQEQNLIVLKPCWGANQSYERIDFLSLTQQTPGYIGWYQLIETRQQLRCGQWLWQWWKCSRKKKHSDLSIFPTNKCKQENVPNMHRTHRKLNRWTSMWHFQVVMKYLYGTEVLEASQLLEWLLNWCWWHHQQQQLQWC